MGRIQRRLAWLFGIKIGVTLVGFCLPLLFATQEDLRAFGFPVGESAFWMRFVGAAYLGVLVTYASGLRALRRGEDPTIALHAAIASNGVGGLFLLSQGFARAWMDCGALARATLWAFGVGALALSFVFLFAARSLRASRDRG